MGFKVRKLAYVLAIMSYTTGYADQFHYQNFLTGDRAIGLGGAYGAVSDDASGVFYNPAGTAFALSNDISGSANAMYSRKVVFKETIGNKDFTEESGGTVPSFFGGLLKIDNIAKGLVLAWGMYSTDSELKDQNDLYEDVILSQNTGCPISGASERGEVPAGSENSVLKRFHRTVNARGASEFIGMSLGYRISNNIALGAGVNYVTVSELIQEYQDVKQSSRICQTDGTFLPGTRVLSQNIRQQLAAMGIQPVLGIQASFFDKLSLGLTMKFGAYMTQSFKRDLENRTIRLLDADQTLVEEAGTQGGSKTFTGLSYADISQAQGSKEFDNPLGSMSTQIRLGVAYFASTRLLFTFDLVHNTAVTNADAETAPYYDASSGSVVNKKVEIYGKDSVTNIMGGVEYYLVPSMPLRVGFFTNNDARPKIKKGDVYKRNTIDYLGGSIFLAWVQPNNQIGAGVILQSGSGEAQKIAASTTVQKIEASSFTFAFSATTTL